MPVTHAREDILDRIVIQLEKIAKDVAYTWASDTNPKVTRIRLQEMNITSFPIIMVGVKGEKKERTGSHGANNVYSSTLDVELNCLIHSYNMDEDLSKILHDVELILGADIRLNNTCVDSRFTGNETFILEDVRPLCGMTISFECDYRYQDNSPSTRLV